MVDEACAAIIQNGTRVLVTRRKNDQSFPLKWELPGGHVEPKESRDVCLKREIKEELGVRIRSIEPYCTCQTRIGKKTIVIHYYLCRIAAGGIKRIEVRDFRWIEPSQHSPYNLSPPDKYVLQKLARARST
jgi:8-oxo-dGTP diphosphatase